MAEDLSSWVGTKVRKGDREGKVIRDNNGRYRVLTVKMDDGREEQIWMANIGPDPEEVHEWEWLNDRHVSSLFNTWLRF